MVSLWRTYRRSITRFDSRGRIAPIYTGPGHNAKNPNRFLDRGSSIFLEFFIRRFGFFLRHIRSRFEMPSYRDKVVLVLERSRDLSRYTHILCKFSF